MQSKDIYRKAKRAALLSEMGNASAFFKNLTNEEKAQCVESAQQESSVVSNTVLRLINIVTPDNNDREEVYGKDEK